SGQFFTVVGVINNTSATVTPAPLVAINNQPLYLRGGSKILPNPGTITINVQATARFGVDAFVTRTNIRCSVPGANSRFRITYNANLRFLQDDYTTITYTIVAPPLTTSTALTGPVPINGSFDILLSQITGPDRNLNIEFRNAAGVLIHTATCLVYGNTANVTRTLTRPWDAGEIEVNQLQRSPGVPANRLRLTNGIDYLLNHLEITFLNLYHYLPPVTGGGFTYVFEVLPRRYILPYVLDPAVWDIYLFNNNTRTEVKQVLNIDYDIVGNVFHWSRTKVLPAFPAGGSFSAQPMIGQQGSAKWTPTVPGTYSYKSYIRPGTHTGNITVTTGTYTVPANKIFSLKAGLKATAKFTAPIAYRDFKVYSYSLCDYYGTFVVVTKNNYNPLILTQYRLSRWYNYHNDKPTFSFGVVKDNSIEPTVNHDYLVHYGVGLPDLKNDLIFLNHIESHINFYGGALKSLITVKSPTSMIHFERIEYTVAGVTYNEIILLGIDGKLYKLKKDLTFEQSIFVFFPVAIPTAPTLLNNDMIGEDAFGIMKWPTTKATPLSSILFPNVKHFCVSDKKIFLIASNVLRMCDYNFNILRTDIVFPEPLHSVVWSTSTVASDFLFVTTEYHKIYSVSTGPGSFTLVTIPFPTNANTVIGIPNQISYGRVLFPFSHEKKLLLVSTIGLTTIDLVSNGIHDFLPFYIRSFKNKAFITGHDTNVVLSLNVEIVGTVVTVDIQPTEFSDKATTVDVNNDAILVSHYMKFRPTLDLTNIEKIIPFTLEDKQGAATFVSSNPKKIKLLGKELISCIPGPFVSWWTNGTHRQLLRTDDYFSINYKGSGNGTFSTFVIIGDTAIDFVVTIYDSTSRMIDYFDPAQNGINAINIAGGGIQYIPPNAILGSLPLPYTLNFFGTIYNDLFTTYNGIIGFDPVYAYNARLPLSYLTTPDQDALILEPVEGWPDLPIDNSDITDIKYGTLDNNAIPGGYIDQGFIGVFAYYKFKYVGTFLNTRPNGNVRITSDIPQTGSSFNFQSITDVVVGQNVSNKLTVSPPTGIAFTNTLTSPINSVTVTAVYNHTQTAQSYYANGTTIYLDANLNPVKKYSNVSSLSGGTKYHSYVDTVSNIFLNIGNAVTHIDAVGANLIMSGIHNPTIGFEWVYDIEEENQTRFISNSTNTPAVVTSGGVSPASSIFRVQSIASSSITFNPKGNITTISNSVTVTSSAYNSVKLNQELFSSIFYLNGGSDFVANKYKIERKLVARTFPAKIKKNVPQSVHVILGKDNLPDGISIPFKITGINLTSIVLPIQVLYTTISMGSYTKLTWYDFPSLWGTETPFRAQVFKNIGDITYDAVNKTLSFNIELYGDLTLGETTEIRFGTQSITDPLHQTEFWKFSADLNYLGNTVGFIFPKAELTSIIFGGAQYNSYIPGKNDPTTGLPEIEKSDALNEYYLGFNKNIYTSFTSNVITGSYTTYQFYPGPAVQTLLGGLTPTSTIAVAATATDVTEVKTSTSLKYRAHMINTVTPIQNQLLEVNNALRTIDLTGKFIDLDYPQNLPAKTELLFKHVYPHPVHTYELAFYWGKNFQYIEYNFNDLHNPAIPKGITNKVGFKEQIIVPIVTPPGNWYSYVWASSALNGIFQSVNKPPYIFGNGVFVPYGIIGNARQPRNEM
ncbi:hypothetical protein EBU71_09020, partial [bacterium]|nr:hypothetical protein [Candidatus Elulimicrobium humile]